MAQSRRKPLSIGNYLVATTFTCLGIASLIDRSWFDAVTWIGIGQAFWAMGNENRQWQAIPGWRKVLAALFVLVALAAVIVRITLDFRSR